MKKRLGFKLALAVAFALAIGCSPRRHQAGSESHFLPCERDADCDDGDSSCVDGVCRMGEAPDASALPESDGGAGAAGSRAVDVPDARAPLPDAGPTAPDGPCDLDTGYPGDDACLLPPAPAEGIQIHIGPKRYDDPAEVARFTLEGTSDREECFSFELPNIGEETYDEWEFSARPGLHHTVYTLYRSEVVGVAAGRFEVCLDDYADGRPQFAGALPVPTEPRVERKAPAPENAGVAHPLPPGAPGQARMHHFNATNAPILRESWLNLYFPRKPPVEQTTTVQLTAGITWQIEPGEERNPTFSCPVARAGRLLSLMSRMAVATRRVSAWLLRADGERLHILEAAHADTPDLFPYDSVSRNPPLITETSGAHTGPVELAVGDTLEWACQISNFTEYVAEHRNPDGRVAVCDLVGVAAGVEVQCLLP